MPLIPAASPSGLDVWTLIGHSGAMAKFVLFALLAFSVGSWAIIAERWRAFTRAQRAVHVSDDSELRMGEYFDLAADLCGLPRAPRIGRAEAATRLSPTQLSFMSESRRLDNRRLKRELRLKLRYPTAHTGLLA